MSELKPDFRERDERKPDREGSSAGVELPVDIARKVKQDTIRINNEVRKMYGTDVKRMCIIVALCLCFVAMFLILYE